MKRHRIKKHIKVLSVIGARPHFVKVALFLAELKKYQRFESILVHTGQHYDLELSQRFFRDLKIPKPRYNLGVGSGYHAVQTARIMERLEPVLLRERPHIVVVMGDTNSTLASALVAAKLHLKLVHIEAGPRAYDKGPEEINRVIVDHLSDILFCPDKKSVLNLQREGIRKGVFEVGDLRYDALLASIRLAEKRSTILKRLNLAPKRYHLVTIHREENTNDRRNLTGITRAFETLGSVVFPCHPRTEKYLKRYKLWDSLKKHIALIKPVGYFDMLSLERNALSIITDSGGIIREAYWLKIPCITVMQKTAALETTKGGWNVLAEANTQKILRLVRTHRPRSQPHYEGRGVAAKRIVRILRKYF